MKNILVIISIISLLFFIGCESNPIESDNKSDIYGCTDPEATNYNPNATIDDGSCEYQSSPASLSNAWGNNPYETSSPISIAGYVTNNGGTTANDVTVVISINYLCNQGFSNGIPGSNYYQMISLGDISPNQTKYYSTESYNPGCYYEAYQIIPSINLSYD